MHPPPTINPWPIAHILTLQLFGFFEVPRKVVFGVHFGQLVDSLGVFASGGEASVDFRYPGPDGELQLE